MPHYDNTDYNGAGQFSRNPLPTIGVKFTGVVIQKGRRVISGSQQLKYLHDPDVQRMLRVQEGDEEAYTELIEAYQDRIVHIFSHLVGGRESAEDLAQEVFLRVYRARETYEPAAKFSTWMFRIANNLASNTRRRWPPDSSPMSRCRRLCMDTFSSASMDASRSSEVIRRKMPRPE